jgi:rRNA processing protein Krr1/Pno1
MVRLDGKIRDLAVDAAGNVTDGIEESRARAVVSAIARGYTYLLGEQQ